MPVAPLDRDRPRRRRRPTATQRARAQERTYVSQGKAVKNAARQQRVAARPYKAPAPKTTPQTRARAQQRQHVSQGVAVRRAAAQQRRVVRRRRAASRKRYFSKKPAEALQRKIGRGERALALLQSSDPEGYAKRRQESRDKKVAGINVEKGMREANKGFVKGVQFGKKFLRTTQDDGHGLLKQSGPGDFAGEGAREVMDIIASAPTSGYQAGAAVNAARKGNTKPAKKLWREFKDTSALSAAVSGNWDEASKRAAERPVTTMLELSGAKAVIGRGGGFAARRAPNVKGFRTIKRAGRTDRPNLRLDPTRKPGEGPEVGRRYSRDIINKGLQVAAERRAAKGSRVRKDGTQRRPGRDPHVDTGTYLVPALPRRVGGASAHAGAPVRAHLVRRADTRQFSQDRASVGRREKAVKETNRLLRRRHATGVQLAAEGTIRATDLKGLRRDLRKRRLDLAKAAQGLTDPHRRKQNAKERKHVRELENLPDEKLLRVLGGAQQYARSQADVQARGRRVGLWDETAQSARFMPALQSHITRPATKERRNLTPEEQRVASKVLQRRARRGQDLPPGAITAIARGESMAARWKPTPVPGAHVAEAIAKVSEVKARKGHPHPEVLARESKRIGLNIPVRVLPLSAKKRGENVRGGYAGIRRDPFTGKDAHTIYLNMSHGQGAKNAALWHELQHALEVERGTRPHAPNHDLPDAEYRKLPAEERANKFMDENMDRDLFSAPAQTPIRVSRWGATINPRPGQPKGVTGATFADYLKQVRTTKNVPARRLTPEEVRETAKILQRRQRRGQSTLAGLPEGGPALITQRPGAGTGRAGHFPVPENMSHARKGGGFMSRDTGREALVRQSAMAERTATSLEGFQLLDREFGRPATLNGQRYADSYGEAVQTARLLEEQSGMAFTPVNIAAFREFGTRLRRKQEEGHPTLRPEGRERESADLGAATAETWNQAVHESGKGRWVLMPEEIVDRFRAHADVATHGILHGATNLFKDVVLTTSSPARWIGGNVTDITMRTAFAGITPLDILRGARIVRQASQRGLQGEQASAAVSGGGLYHAAEALNRSVGRRGTGENPARTVMAAPFRAWKGMVYSLEHSIEVLPQYGAVGKAMRRDIGREARVKLPVAQVRKATPDQFARAVQRTPDADGYLTPYSAKDYGSMDLYLAPDGKSGFALRDGELINLFAQPGAKFRGTQVLAAAERRGATKLDATSLPGAGLERFYGKRGWNVDKVERWDPQYGEPPVKGQRVVFMSRDPLAQRAADFAMKRDLKSMLKLHDQQIESYAHNLATDRAVEARLQKVTEDVIGRWGKISPTMRRALVIAPFAQWLGAATRYVYVTLPVHHPIKTGILAGISEMTEEERIKLGLSYHAPRDKQVYDYQMGTLPLEVGKNKYGPVIEGVRTARMTSFGTAGSVPGNLGEFLFPQFAGALDAWSGTSFTNEQLVYPDWWPEVEKRRLPMPPDELQAIGLGALLESSIPFASAFRRSILEQGRPAEPYSTILTPATRKRWDKEDEVFKENKGTAMGGILEWLSPYAPKSRVYTYGAGKAIEEQGITGETLERWRKLPRRNDKSDKYGFGGGVPADRPLTDHDPYGFQGEPTTKERKERNPYGF